MKKEEKSQESLDKLDESSSAESFKWNCLSNDDLLTIVKLLNVKQLMIIYYIYIIFKYIKISCTTEDSFLCI